MHQKIETNIEGEEKRRGTPSSGAPDQSEGVQEQRTLAQKDNEKGKAIDGADERDPDAGEDEGESDIIHDMDKKQNGQEWRRSSNGGQSAIQ